MEWNPEDYARNSSAQLGWAKELIAHLHLHGDEAILDVGCGDGKISAAFAGSVPDGSVIGVDNSAGFIAYARAHYPPERYPNLRFEQMDARELTGDRPFDLVFSNAVLHWVADHRAFLSGCHRLLKPDGTLVISCGGAGNAADVSTVTETLMHMPHWAGYFSHFIRPYYFYSPAEYRVWLPEAGLTASRLELVEKDMVHAGREGLMGWMRTTWLLPYIPYIPEPLRDEFANACADLYLTAHPLDASGRSHVRMVRLEVEARKN
jgi:trans-aconitate methyltransferase